MIIIVEVQFHDFSPFFTKGNETSCSPIHSMNPSKNSKLFSKEKVVEGEGFVGGC